MVHWLCRIVSCSCFLQFSLACSLDAAEDWADKRLTVREGLQLWLDAASQPAARTAQGQPAISDKSPVDRWYDGSGRARHVAAPADDARPRFLNLGAAALFRFDGQQDCLRYNGPEHAIGAFTAFIVADAHKNPGEWHGFLAANQPDRRDYETGFTIDLGSQATFAFRQLNVEGRGFRGAMNVMQAGRPFGKLCVIRTVADPTERTIRLWIDNEPQRSRPFDPAPLRIDEITVGARYYTNGPGPQQVRGFLAGDIAEVLLYDRVLSTSESDSVQSYLTAKYAAVKVPSPPVEAAPGTAPLVQVESPPPVQMFVPGFAARELPLELTNINNVKYREDGKLVAVGYDGNVWLLGDSDGDGLEDRAELFWDNQGRIQAPIGMALTPPGYKHGRGLFIACMGKCSLVVDTDGDDRADREIIVAEGWPKTIVRVDALGVAVDPQDQSIYFGLGTPAFSNAYVLDQQGQAQYDVAGERGTILRVSPDFKQREIIATGVRFSVAMAFNRHGDLFCTEQEGATWLANGNPFDELLHIERGRHYGFPPRHPRHLPGVIDEPSTFDYGPQHQSACGLNFNEPVNGGPVFGPEWWRGDAIVAGYSRGKLYRTKLAKTPEGYVAQNNLIGCLNMLTADACVSPRGDLVVATHSGEPDWGSGPTGPGKLYQVSYRERRQPQPVAIWAATPNEVQIAFDQPLDPRQLADLKSALKIAIAHGEGVAAGDRFESLRPGYAVVVRQLEALRSALSVLGVQITPDHRTLLVQTARHPGVSNYAIQLPQLSTAGRDNAASSTEGLPQSPEIDLRYDLCGAEATWTPADGHAPLSVWLPHVDPTVAQAFTAGSAQHEELWMALQRSPGQLALRTQLDLTDMLRPAVQPGGQIDYTWPVEEVTIRLVSNRELAVRCLDQSIHSTAGDATAGDGGTHVASVTLKPAAGSYTPLEILLAADGAVPTLRIGWHTAEDARERPFPLRRMLLPWVSPKVDSPQQPFIQPIPELAGGSWERGRQVFFNEQVGCFKCHRVNQRGGETGPDLSNLVHRDYRSVLRDVSHPSAALNPDYITQVVVLKDGRILTGAVRPVSDNLLIGDAQGNVTVVKQTDVEELALSPLSTMPEKLPELLGPERLRDVVTFLLTPPPRLSDYGPLPPPSPRTREEVDAVLARSEVLPQPLRPLHVVLVAGRKDHGPGEHDYPAWMRMWSQLMRSAENVTVSTAMEWPADEDIRTADCMVFFQRGNWTAERARQIDPYLERGGGLVYIHYAVDGGNDAPGFAQRIGLAWQGGRSRFRHGALDLAFDSAKGHPIARNFDKLHLHDESYWQGFGDPSRINVLATGVEDGQPQPLFWTMQPGNGRVFVSIPGHFSWTFDDPLFRILLLRGIAWTAKEPVDRFNDLATMGVEVANDVIEARRAER